MEFTTEQNSKGGFRFDVRNPPAPGAELNTLAGDVVVFDEIGLAGMLACTRKRDGVQSLYMPHDFSG